MEKNTEKSSIRLQVDPSKAVQELYNPLANEYCWINLPGLPINQNST